MDTMMAQIIMFGGNFAPRGWAFCEGQLLPIASYNALFSLLGTTYGGDGRTTFGLPDLRGRTPIHKGTGPGLPAISLGQKGGSATTTLQVANIPAHGHTAQLGVSTAAGEDDSPSGNVLAQAGSEIYGSTVNGQMAADSIKVDQTGGSQSFSNMQPFLGVSYIIALEGVYPSRS